MSELSDDEFAVLCIANKGESMIPIGRWKEPTLSLARRGLLHANDPSNYVITAAGRVACCESEDASLRQVLESGAKVANARTQAQQSIEQAALHLSYAAKASAVATGDPVMFCLDKWLPSIRERAVEILKDG